MLRDVVMLAIGFAIGWIVLARPQWATDLWQRIKHWFGGPTPPVAPA